MRFPSRKAHVVFLEQEGWATDEIYVQGVSNSMPPDVQYAMLRTIPGLEGCVMARPGYAIEHDCLDSRSLTPQLGCCAVPGLFFAGQVNGTSGYEGAAAQGFIAGVNAARAVQGKVGIAVGRQGAYLGAMVHDLTTGVWTSRAARSVPAPSIASPLGRMLPLAEEMGIAGTARIRRLRQRLADLQGCGLPGAAGPDWIFPARSLPDASAGPTPAGDCFT